jgi:AcrR family transcriptional regulator
MRADPQPRWNRLDRDVRRSQILLAAKRLFRDRSYSAVSTTELAEAAGVTRGLLHHYFGTKRDLYLEVVRDLVRVPAPLIPEEVAGRELEEVVAENVAAWLEMVERNRKTWLAAIGAHGIGRDPELERIIDEAREQMAETMIEGLRLDAKAASRSELRAVIRAYGAMAEGATREWLQRRRLDRDQVQVLLTDTLVAMLRDVLPRVTELGRGEKAKSKAIAGGVR